MIPPPNMNRPASIQEEGWVAFYDGKDSRPCPYTGDASRKAWLDGWHAAEEWFANE
ncbi:MAG: hypothetical protein H2048_02750 [Erythrobacter sp.]|nr:hypothetical protein [Erythrobacter sp.]